jgi:predicted NBD/HSP70 family sugar kinase
VVFGGGIEREETFFTESVKESMKKFLSSNIADRLKIIPGVLGKESSSIGAALLCRRELFMEV